MAKLWFWQKHLHCLPVERVIVVDNGYDPGLAPPQSTRHCLRCAGRSDRVCFTVLQPACVVREENAEAQPFREHLGVAMSGLPLRYASPLKAALRDLLLRADETALDTEAAPDCKYREPTAPTKPAVELLTFFRQYCALLALAALVCLAECAAGWFCTRCS
ncbi:hypothetical protein MTO96_029213 [Rhipicephalus appendiculatus]